jgi:nicotinamide-nucleotide amidase
MIVEVVAVGTELLLGAIVNGNAATIGRAVAEQGFDAHFAQVVGDNPARMEQALELAMSRSDAVIITGGIGPTQDDITREAIAAVTGRPLLRNDDYVEELRNRFAASGRDMPANNARQADYPEGAEQLPNPKGTAPGIALRHEGTWLFALPGVPQEMEALLADHVLPRLRRVAGDDRTLVSRLIRTWGRSESQVAERLDDLFQASDNPSIAFLASSGEIKVRITAKAPTEEEALRMIEPVEDEVRSRLGASVFGVNDETIEAVVLAMARGRGWSVGTAESATGGLVASRLTSVAGASDVFRGSIVAYAEDLKRDLLNVDAGLLDEAVVSEATARAMAQGARVRLGVDVAVAITGSAGPSPQERPVGTMVIGVVTPDGVGARTVQLPGDRERVRTYASTAALHLARLAISGTWWRT